MGMSALLAETTRLLTMFQDKEKGINASVAAAIAAVPEMSKDFYVNAIAGDDDVGTGAFSKPFKLFLMVVGALLSFLVMSMCLAISLCHLKILQFPLPAGKLLSQPCATCVFRPLTGPWTTGLPVF